MPKLYFYTDGPTLYEKGSDKHYLQGGSPNLLKNLFEYINHNKRKIKNIYISYMLFNNIILHKFLKNLPSNINIHVFSIPLEGYDKRYHHYLYDIETGEKVCNKKMSKYQIAQKIYEDIQKKNLSNYHLHIFPHQYVRSKWLKAFSRGELPYSLHIKSMYIEFNNGLGSNVLSSSNFASVDRIKEEVMIILEDAKNFYDVSIDFYKQLKANSIPIDDFKENNDFTNYKIIKSEKKPKYAISNKNSYLGPFYKQSQNAFKHNLIEIINSASEHIYICAQHVSAYSEEKTNVSRGILNYVIDKANEGLPVNILSQTYSNEENNNYRKPINQRAFRDFIKALPKDKNIFYGVNSDIHSKFIVVDETVIFTSCNLTPTQFIYMDVDIKSFHHNPDMSYKGIHSEVGQYIVINNRALSQKMIAYFSDLKSRNATNDVSPQ